MDSRNTNAELNAEADAIARRILDGRATASDASTVIELSNRLMRYEPRRAADRECRGAPAAASGDSAGVPNLIALLAEARAAIEPLTGAQIKLHRIKLDLADRIDAALSGAAPSERKNNGD
jgi:hypothetical protein